MKKLVSLCLALALFLTLAACGGGADSSGNSGEAGTSAQEADYPTAENPITLKLGHVGPPASSLQIAAETMADEIKEATGGAVLIEVYPQSQLGDAVVMLDGLSNGTLEMAMVGCNEIATMLPDFYAFCLPFLFSDIDEFINVARDPEVSAKANEIMNSKGITLIGFSSGESRGYSNTQHTVRTPADIAGQKVRIQAGTIYVDTFEALGAVPSTMAFSEVYSALQQGVVDAEDNGADMLTKMKFAEVEKYHTVLNHMIQSNPLLISTEVWNRLSPEQQDAIKTAEANWGDGYLDFIHEQLDASIQSAEEAGVEITELTDAEFQAFKDATSSVYDTYVPQIDPAVYELVCNKIDALRG
jgi:TRAP transporter solute receptor, dctP family